jgi:hypothetical protein
MSEVQEVIFKTITDFFDYPWGDKDLLTEDDIRCRLFCNLQKDLSVRNNISIHSEVRWYGYDEKKLKYRSDIVIIDDDDLRVEADLFRLPSKGYGFDRYYSIIEIKLWRRNNTDSDQEYNKVIQKDIDKLKEIREKTNSGNSGDKSYYLIAFDSKKNRKILVDNIDSSDKNWVNWNCNNLG